MQRLHHRDARHHHDSALLGRGDKAGNCGLPMLKLCDGPLGSAVIWLAASRRLRNRRALELGQEWPIDLFDMDAAVLNRFDAVGGLKKLPRGDFRIGEGAGLDELHADSRHSMWTA
jgi:hypothetical protein